MSYKDSDLYLLVMIYISLEVDLISLAKERLAPGISLRLRFWSNCMVFLLTSVRIRERTTDMLWKFSIVVTVVRGRLVGQWRGIIIIVYYIRQTRQLIGAFVETRDGRAMNLLLVEVSWQNRASLK